MNDATGSEPAIDATMALLRARYAGRFGAEDEARLREQVRALRQAAEAVTAVPLTNADEPATPFAAWRED
ncbi:MAG: hypothetical protein U0531_06580 [Dehalococcoidia bacterium]